MESELSMEMRRRMARTFLDMLILVRLREQALGGYGVVKFVHRKFHILLSTGSAYSELHSMERRGLIEQEWNKGSRVYTLTEKGEEIAESFLKLKEEVLSVVFSLFTK